MKVGSNSISQTVEVSLGWLDVLSLFAGISSLVVGGLAIWLSVVFYRMSEASSKEVQQSATNINNNVEKLEKMFDTMYSDTFSMVKDNVIHMRKQVDRNSNSVDHTSEIKRKVEELISNQLKKVSPEKLNNDEIKDIFMNILKESKEIEIDVKKQSMKDDILEVLSKEGEKSFNYLQKRIIGENNSKEVFRAFFDTVYNLKQEGIIDAEFANYEQEGLVVSSDEPIRLLKAK